MSTINPVQSHNHLGNDTEHSHNHSVAIHRRQLIMYQHTDVNSN